MIKRKKILLGLVAVTIGILGGILVNNLYIKKKSDGIKIISYKEPKASESEINEKGYKINKFENINGVEWINNNEVLTLTNKSGGYNPTKYCSIYNLNTKESADFKDVSIASNGYFGLSENKKYVLYGEDRYIPNYFENNDGNELTDEQKKSNEEWEALCASGELYHQKIKIVEIETGKIIDLKTQKINSNADYRWIGDDKVLVIYNNLNNGWEVINIKGDIVSEGTFDYSNSYYPHSSIVGVEDVKNLGTTVEGYFYYTKNYKKEDGSVDEKVYLMDVNTKEEKLVDGVETVNKADKKGNLIAADFNKDKVDKSIEETNCNKIHRTFGINIFNTALDSLQSLELPEGLIFSKYKLSDDGSKLGYIQSLRDYAYLGTMDDDINAKTILSVMNVKDKKIKEIVKLSDLKENNSEQYECVNLTDISWNKNGRALMFTCVYKVNNKYTIKLDEVGKEMYQTKNDETEISILEHAKTNTYIVTFDY